MIQTFYNLGLALKDKYPEYFHPWQNPFVNKEDNAEVLVFDVENGKLKRSEPVPEKFSKEPDYLEKYLYREAGGNKPNIVPTYILNTTYPEKTIKKINQSIKKYGHTFLNDALILQVENALNVFVKQQATKGTGYLLTFRIDGRYLGEIDDMKALFIENAYEEYHTKVYGTSKKKNGVCSLTGKTGMVYGFVDTLGFTVNDKAFMRNGFNQNDAYKMFPVTPEAIPIIEGAKAFVRDKKLEHKFFGKIKYYVLPHFISVIKISSAREVISLFADKSVNSIRLRDKASEKSLLSTEEILNEIAEDKEEKLGLPGIYYEFLFWWNPQLSQTALLLHMPDVMPSRIKMLFGEKRALEIKYAYLTNSPNYSFFITLASMRGYFAKDDITHPFFWKLMEAIFCKGHIKEKVFKKFLLDKWRISFKRRDKYFTSSAIEGFITYRYLNNIGIFQSNKKNHYIMESKHNAENAIDFIVQHPDFFASDFKKAVFLTGCLTQKLASFQPNQAILKKVNNLHIDEKVLRKLLPSIVIKIKQHDKEYADVRQLEETAASLYVTQKDIDNDEMSFVFTLGLVLQRKFDDIAKGKSK